MVITTAWEAGVLLSGAPVTWFASLGQPLICGTLSLKEGKQGLP